MCIFFCHLAAADVYFMKVSENNPFIIYLYALEYWYYIETMIIGNISDYKLRFCIVWLILRCDLYVLRAL